MAKLLTTAQFTQRLATVTQAQGYQVEKVEDLLLWLNWHGTKFRCRLLTAYQAYKSSPELLESIVESHLAALKQVPALPVQPFNADDATALLPLLQQSSWVEQTQKSGVTPLFYRPFVPGIVTSYVFDFPQHRAYVNIDSAEEMRISGKLIGGDLHQQALHNLSVRAKSYETLMIGSFAETMISCESRDGYAATTILLPELMQSWKKKIAGRMLIGVPNRDFIIAFSDRHPAGVAGIAEQVRRDAAQRNDPLVSRLLLWEAGKISDYVPLQ